MFDREEFRRLDAAFGPFTCDAACDNDGANAHVAARFYCPSRSFLKADVTGQTVWMVPPLRLAEQFLQHYFDCKSRCPTHTSAIIILPDIPSAPWRCYLQNLELIETYPAHQSLFTTQDQNGRRVPAPPSHHRHLVYWDRPAALSIDAEHHASSACASGPPASSTADSLASHKASEPVEVFTLLQSPRAVETMLIVFDGNLYGRSVKVLLDSGASKNFYNRDSLRNCEIKTNKIKSLKVRSADGGIIYSNQSADLPVDIGGFRDTIDSCVATQLAGYDIILGKPWLTCHNPAVDW